MNSCRRPRNTCEGCCGPLPAKLGTKPKKKERILTDSTVRPFFRLRMSMPPAWAWRPWLHDDAAPRLFWLATGSDTSTKRKRVSYWDAGARVSNGLRDGRRGITRLRFVLVLGVPKTRQRPSPLRPARCPGDFSQADCNLADTLGLFIVEFQAATSCLLDTRLDHRWIVAR